MLVREVFLFLSARESVRKLKIIQTKPQNIAINNMNSKMMYPRNLKMEFWTVFGRILLPNLLKGSRLDSEFLIEVKSRK